ncbi:MAG: ribokinase [Acetobacteraceae bacterium]|nr:ribokinase [Acetobacteraceae bacterium]MBV8399627.1 ribokinase [Acetobacteraceae bacterium]MBV8575557.1 ribokinase [Acetobacteraceae bacterium]
MIVVFGSINLDLIFPLPFLPAAGETVLTRSVRIEPGGKGANQAVAAARDGARVVMAGAVGRDALAGTAFAGLREAGVDLSRVVESDEGTGVAAVCVDRAGNNAIAVGSGANLAARADQVDDALLGPGTTLLVQMETDAEQVAYLIRRARARGARVVLNLAPAGPLPMETLRQVDVLVVNESEAAWLAAHLDTAPDAAALREALDVDTVRTLGGDGTNFAAGSETGLVPAYPVEPVDTTGAGDCFTGVLAAALDRGASLPDAIRRASVAGALACTRVGAQASLPQADEIDLAIRNL